MILQFLSGCLEEIRFRSHIQSYLDEEMNAYECSEPSMSRRLKVVKSFPNNIAKSKIQGMKKTEYEVLLAKIRNLFSFTKGQF